MRKNSIAALQGQVAFKPSRMQALGLFVATASLGGLGFLADPVSAAAPAPAPAPARGAPVDAPPKPEGLKGVAIPEPSNLADFVQDRAAAVRLGKALFWDMQLGSDGQTACATCHFHGGADSRSRNQISPGLKRESSPGVPNPDTTFQLGGPNYQLKATDFPFHKFADPKNRKSAVLRTHNDVASSQGVFNTNFVGALPGAVADEASLAGDAVFQLNGLQTRRVEPRNTPSFINSVLNFRNFFDGRATYLFNGVSPFGAMDATAKVHKTAHALSTTASPVTVRIDKASLASLATGPALSDLEMSAVGRSWPEIGKRLLAARPLVQQQVHATDSVLAGARHESGTGLNGSYESMVKSAFKPEWWKGTNLVTINGKTYTQAQANFSLFFGLAIQMYGATQVSDDSPFDRHMAGNGAALSTEAKLGLAVFFGKGKCAECHNGAEFTTAATRNILKSGPLSRMVMGNGGTAVYDEGFYNTAVKQTLEDIANGARNPVGKPMSTARLAQEVGSAEFLRLIGVPANLVVTKGERLAINGAFKTPGIRNIELTAPYFHNGDSLTLEQVVEFYNRGGNHFQNNLADVDPDIEPLGLTAAEQKQLVAFMKSLTDDRVRLQKAPFDHPELRIPNGHLVEGNGSPVLDKGRVKEAFFTLPAVGSSGSAAPKPNFLTEVGFFSLAAAHSGKCVDVGGASMADAGNVAQWGCHGGDNQLWEEVPATHGFMLRNKHSGKCMDVAGISTVAGARIYQWACHGGPNQVFNWVGSRLVVNHSKQCVNVTGASQADGGNIVQWPCTAAATNDQFAKR